MKQRHTVTQRQQHKEMREKGGGRYSKQPRVGAKSSHQLGLTLGGCRLRAAKLPGGGTLLPEGGVSVTFT